MHIKPYDDWDKRKTFINIVFLNTILMNNKMHERILDIMNIVLENRSKRKLDSITEEMHLRNDIGFDSLDLAELTVRIEAEYNIDIFEENIINTVGEIFKKLADK